uniref:PDZ domain-containing protein n=1 Tax=Zooxanthella nutricula TaxID=1333877 RepID=A0A7S2N3D7_9DINO
MFLCCCVQETDKATVVHVPSVAVWEAPLAEAEAEVRVVEEAAAVDAPKVEAPAAPPAPPASSPTGDFDAVLERPSASTRTPFGWGLDMLCPDALHIESLSGDPTAAVTRYNASAPAGRDIRVGDYIIRVNGAAGSAKSLGEALLKHSTAQVTVQRPKTYAVEIKKGDKALGVDLNYTTQGKSIYVVSIRDGVIKEQVPEVGKGQRIVSVNGKASSPKEMIEALKTPWVKLELSAAPVV